MLEFNKPNETRNNLEIYEKTQSKMPDFKNRAQ